MKTKSTIKSPKKGYSVYVVELRKSVFNDHWQFRQANPQFNGALQCLYVGMTSNTPEERFRKHKTGHRNAKGHKISSNIVEKYGLYLRPSLYEEYNPMTKQQAIKMEEELALALRRKGYGVWWN